MDLDRLCLFILNNVERTFSFPLLIILIALLLLSAFFSMSETAYSSCNIVRLRVYTEDGKKDAKRALETAENFEKTLTTVLVGNNIVNITMATIATRFFALFILNSDVSDLVSTIAITVMVLIFGEIVPKSLAKKYADWLALKLATPIFICKIILFPFTCIFGAIQKALSFSHNDQEPSVTEDELESILDTMSEEGVIHDDEAELIQSVLDLNDKTVGEIMVPRVDVIAVDISDEVDKIKKVFFDTQYSRIPVYDGDKDNIVGILYERDFFTKIIKNQRINIKNIMKPALFVSKSMKVDALIHELQKKKMHIAIVSGEFGQTSGIVTMEDALEELVGEIYDEHDDTQKEILKKISDNEYLVNADIEMGDLFEALDINKELDDKYMKLSAWLYEQTEDLPEEGKEIKFSIDFVKKDDEDKYEDCSKTLTFLIRKVVDRRIKMVHLKIDDSKDEDSE